ncbi:MAG: TetR/AcrR family transcriptional regulator, partial [Treponema sp.]|nr:TetR/AcrR family transcriptional regulator [Treponema sp.]
MTRDDIIGAAFKVWGRELYKVTSLSKLADTLGVSKPALYRHFPDKQALLDAMERRFFDDYAANIKPAIEKVRELESWQERILIMVRGMTEFFSFNFDYFIFSLDKMSQKDHFHHYTDELEKRGIRFSEFAPKDAPLLRLFGERCTVSAGEIPEIFFADPIGGGNPANFFVDYPSVLFFAGITAIFETGRYHKQRSLQVLHKVQDPSGISGAGDPLGVAAAAVEKVRKGLGFNREIVEALPFEALEKPGIEAPLPPNSLFMAVAEAVALAGPWNASMEMVAKLSGLSKSGLYAHFKSKEDMLSKLFVPEFKRIAELAVKYAGLSERREERLYLVLFSIA